VEPITADRYGIDRPVQRARLAIVPHMDPVVVTDVVHRVRVGFGSSRDREFQEGALIVWLHVVTRGWLRRS